MSDIAAQSPAAVLLHCGQVIATALPGYLSTAQSGLSAVPGLTLPLPVVVYYGSVEDQQGQYPAIGLVIERTRIAPEVSAEYTIEHAVAVTVSLYEGSVGATDPSSVYLAAMAYVAAVCECLSVVAPRTGGALGLYGGEVTGCSAERSPFVVTATPEQQYATRRALGRLILRQSTRRGIPL